MSRFGMSSTRFVHWSNPMTWQRVSGGTGPSSSSNSFAKKTRPPNLTRPPTPSTSVTATTSSPTRQAPESARNALATSTNTRNGLRRVIAHHEPTVTSPAISAATHTGPPTHVAVPAAVHPTATATQPRHKRVSGAAATAITDKQNQTTPVISMTPNFGTTAPRKLSRPCQGPPTKMVTVSINEKDVQRAKNIALFNLGRAPQPRQKLHTAAARKGIPDDAIRQALDELANVGLVDDQAYSETYAETRRRSRHLSARAIARELARKGVEQDVIDETTSTISAEDDVEAAQAYANKKAPRLVGLPPQVAVRRLAGQLARRGHNPGVAFHAAKQAIDSTGTSN